jgi:hypothetical protein
MRVQAALYYDSTGVQTYGAAVAGVGAACTGGMFSDATMAAAVAQVTTQAGSTEPSCYVATDKLSFAIAAKLKTTGAGTYCVDSAGAGKVLTTATASTVASPGVATNAVVGTAATSYACQ